MPRSKGRVPRNLGRVTPYRATPYVAGEGRLFALEREADHQETMRSVSERRKRPVPIANTSPYPSPSYSECRFCKRGIQRGAPSVTASLGFGASGVVHANCAVAPVAPPSAGGTPPLPGRRLPEEPEWLRDATEAAWKQLRAVTRVVDKEAATVDRAKRSIDRPAR
jgi:hypothetical protein